MAAINFDGPSKGRVSSTEPALSVLNTGNGEGVRGTTNSDTDAAVVGVSNGRARAGHFQSVGGEGVRGTTNSDTDAAVVGVSNGRAAAGLFSGGAGSAVVGLSNSGIGVHGRGGRLAGYFEGDVEVTGDIRLLNADCAEDFDICETEQIEPGTVMVLGEEGKL